MYTFKAFKSFKEISYELGSVLAYRINKRKAEKIIYL